MDEITAATPNEDCAAQAEAVAAPDLALSSARRMSRLAKAWRWLRPVLGIALLGYLVWRVNWREIGEVLAEEKM